ncbi:MAG TPA: hypothetical protein VFD58_14080 [Blastocatellia bacterium]|nr:hypothetical protein [Blastocatellia bacterium]
MKLPQSLAPWAQYLNLFPPELSLALGAMARRIAVLVGPLRARAMAGEIEPDGFDGLAQRGVYERLLATEWALAEEAPDEFNRRAVMNEHLFFRIARRNPAGSRVSLALFDAGPNQAGSPRLAHLAALVVLARRAEAAGAHFGWGVIQLPGMTVMSEVDGASVLRLLESRSPSEVKADDLNAWRNRVADWHGLDDLWLVGGKSLVALPAGLKPSRMEVSDVLEPDVRCLSVTVRSASGVRKEVRLDLPEDKVCARLLRDPFGVATAEPKTVKAKFTPASNLVFDSSGTKLFALSADGGLIAYPVPNSPRAGTGKPKLYQSGYGGRIVAAGRYAGSIVLLKTHGEGAFVEHLRRKGYLRDGARFDILSGIRQAFPEPNAELRSCFRVTGSNELLVAAPNKTLFKMKLPGPFLPPGETPAPVTAEPVAANVLAITQTYSRVIYLGQEVTGGSYHVVSIGSAIERTTMPGAGSDPPGAFFGYGGGYAHWTFGLLVVQESEDRWIILTAQGEVTVQVRLSAGERVVGVGVNRDGAYGAGLVILEGDDRTLRLQGRDWHRTLVTAPAKIEHVTASHAAPFIAYSTVDGAVYVYSIKDSAMVCQFLPRDRA